MDDRNSREQRPLLIAEFNLRGKKQKFEMTNIPLSPLRDLLPGLLTARTSSLERTKPTEARLETKKKEVRVKGSERIKPHFGYSSPRLSFLSEVESRGEGDVCADYAAEIPEKSERDLSAPFSLPSQNERFLPRRGGGGGSRTCKLRPREAAIWFLARTFITGDLCCSGATLADGYKLITLVSRPASRSPFSFFLPIPRECLETRVYAWILPNRYGFLHDSQSYHGKPG